MSSLTDPNLITIMQGKTWRCVFVLNNPGATPTPVNLAGYGATFTVYNRAGGTALLSVNDLTANDPETNQPWLSGDTAVVVQPGTTPALGTVAVRLGADMTATLTRSGAYDVSIYLHSDPTEVQPLASGPMLLLPYGSDETEAANYAP